MRSSLLLLLIPLAALSSRSWAADRVVGLVEIPALASGNAGVPVGPVALFAEPDLEAEVAVVARNWAELESREHGYEEASATVYDRADNEGGGFWYKVRYVGGGSPIFAWLSQADAEQYRPIHSLILKRGLTYLTDAWDLQLYESPDLGSAKRSIGGRGDVSVIDVEEHGGQTWYLVVLVSGNVCTGGVTKIRDTGWIPAYAPDGRLNVGWSSRGC